MRQDTAPFYITPTPRRRRRLDVWRVSFLLVTLGLWSLAGFGCHLLGGAS